MSSSEPGRLEANGEPEGALPLGPSAGLPEGSIRIVTTGRGVEVGVFKLHGEIRAYENYCPHQGGPVCYGELIGQLEAVLDDKRRVVAERFSEERFNLVCPWHGWSYEAMTGRCIGDPRSRYRLKRWEVVEKDGELFLTGPSGGGS